VKGEKGGRTFKYKECEEHAMNSLQASIIINSQILALQAVMVADGVVLLRAA
jgi:hypothetical protein